MAPPKASAAPSRLNSRAAARRLRSRISTKPEDIPVAEWERILSLNLMSVVRSNAVFLPKMIARGSGYIVNTASFAGLYPFAASRMPYVAAKAGVVALSESMALYLQPKGIRVSCGFPAANTAKAAMKEAFAQLE